MKDGNWIPLDKNLKKALPKDRAYTELEAAFSLTCDYDSQKTATIAGYANLWSWSRTKVKTFLTSMKVDIIYPENTGKKQNQKGQIKRQIQCRYSADTGQIRMVDSKGLRDSKDRYSADREQIESRSKSTTINPKDNPNPKPKPKTKKKIYAETSKEFQLAILLKDNILKHKPDFNFDRLNMQTWAKEADFMLRIDKRDLEVVKKLIVWVQKDSFERSNVLSIAKLRKRFDSLEIKMNTKKPSGQTAKETIRSFAEIAAEMPEEIDFFGTEERKNKKMINVNEKERIEYDER